MLLLSPLVRDLTAWHRGFTMHSKVEWKERERGRERQIINRKKQTQTVLLKPIVKKHKRKIKSLIFLYYNLLVMIGHFS